MTDFHCIRSHGNIRVPSSKVCGFRTANRATKSGWSSGLRTGSDNACGHRLSRFSTDLQADEAEVKCGGNQNWLNYEGATFNKSRVNHPHQMDRQAFRAGTEVIDRSAESVSVHSKHMSELSNDRQGTGNYQLRRPAFTAPPVEPRQAIDFDSINAINIAQFGTKIQIGESTLEKLLGVRLPDPSDKNWVVEFERRKASGDSAEQLEKNPPFGRPQRTIKKMINFGEASLDFAGSLAALTAAVSAGRTETLEQRRVLGLVLAQILSSSENVRNLTGRKMAEIKVIVDRLSVPQNYIDNGFTHRIFGNNQYNEQPGLINLFLLSNPLIPHINTPIRTERPDGEEDGWITMSSMITNLRRKGAGRRWIDLGTRRLIFKDTAEAMVKAGIDNGMLDGVRIAPGEEKKDGGPVIIEPGEFGEA